MLYYYIDRNNTYAFRLNFQEVVKMKISTKVECGIMALIDIAVNSRRVRWRSRSRWNSRPFRCFLLWTLWYCRRDPPAGRWRRTTDGQCTAQGEWWWWWRSTSSGRTDDGRKRAVLRVFAASFSWRGQRLARWTERRISIRWTGHGRRRNCPIRGMRRMRREKQRRCRAYRSISGSRSGSRLQR